MSNFWNRVQIIISDKALRTRMLFTLGFLIVFRALAAIPIPGVDPARLSALFSGNQFLGLLNIFSGGGLSNLSIVMLAVGPFITASIIMQLLTMMSPKLKQLYQEEGEAGRKKFTQYSRLLTVPIALVQSFGFLSLLAKQGVLGGLGPFEMAVNIIVISAGSMLLMWVGELITEFGIGNGVSLIIFAGIVSRVPTAIGQEYVKFEGASSLPTLLGFLVIGLIIVFGIVMITEAERPIPVTYAKRVRGTKMFGGTQTYLPLRLNQAGVIPIIFALSILLIPQMIFNFLTAAKNATIANIATKGAAIIANQWLYAVLYFILVFIFTYFYTAVTFDPDSIATNLQKNGAFIPGVRPGQSTSEYISRILVRITLFGAVFLGIIAVLPLIMKNATGDTTLAIGGTALLIVVSVVLDLFKRIDAQVSMREY